MSFRLTRNPNTRMILIPRRANESRSAQTNLCTTQEFAVDKGRKPEPLTVDSSKPNSPVLIRVSPRRKEVLDKNAAEGQPPSTASNVHSQLCLRHRSAADSPLQPDSAHPRGSLACSLLAPSLPRGVRRICQSRPPSVISRSRTGHRRQPAALSCFNSPKRTKQGWGRRPQRPGYQSRSRAPLGFPPAISPSRKIAGYRRICRDHSADRELTFFAGTHFPRVCCARQQKTPTRLCRSCGRPRFPVEARGKPQVNCRRELDGTTAATRKWHNFGASTSKHTFEWPRRVTEANS